MTTTSAAVRQLSDANSQGTVLGQSPTDKIAFYTSSTSAPIVQPGFALTGSQNIGMFTGVNQASTGVLTKYQANITSNSVAATTAVTATATVSSGVFAGLATSSVIFGNKPDQQAGLGVAGYVASSANTLTFNYVNVSSAAIIPTVTDIWDIVEIKGPSPIVTTAVLSPAAVPINTSTEQIFTITGNACLPGTVGIVNKPTNQTGLGYSPFCRVVAPNQVGVTFFAVTSGVVTTAVTPTAAETYQFAFLPQLNAFNPTYIYTISGTQNATTASTTTEATTTVGGILATDFVSGISKPTVNASTAVTSGRVTAAGVIGITYLTQSAASTPSSSEILTVAVQRQVPLNPVAIYTTTCAATTCAATTSVEATTTVTGLLVSTSVAVNKPTLTPGLAVVNARVSAANTLAIQYMNFTTTSISVPSETYTIANVQLQGPSTAASVSSAQSVTQQFYPGVQQTLQVAAATRQALVSLGLLAGI
jgi:hypothetical protein